MLVLASALMFTMGCDDRSGLSGRYAAHNDKGRISPPVTLELKPNGEGTWATEEDNISFKWQIKGEEIWLLTKSGGVIVGKIGDDTINVSLPGVAPYHFKKVKR
jgi:hypothetical protein